MKTPLAGTLVMLLSLAACGASPPAKPPPARSSDSVAKTGTAVAQAPTSPQSDLNLVSAPIPQVLLDAQRAPYGEPADGTCAGLTASVRALDAVLGPDLDVPPLPGNPGLIERSASPIGQAATQPVRGAAESVAPLRNWVRNISGAERYSRDVAAAIAGGTVRRAFLKGLGQVRGCAFPAAPAVPDRP
jgi:predicted small lipoprotein YifL